VYGRVAKGIGLVHKLSELLSDVFLSGEEDSWGWVPEKGGVFWGQIKSYFPS
jgi:hypothetical protein